MIDLFGHYGANVMAQASGPQWINPQEEETMTIKKGEYTGAPTEPERVSDKQMGDKFNAWVADRNREAAQILADRMAQAKGLMPTTPAGQMNALQALTTKTDEAPAVITSKEQAQAIIAKHGAKLLPNGEMLMPKGFPGGLDEQVTVSPAGRLVKALRAAQECGPGIAAMPKTLPGPDFSGWVHELDLIPDADG